MKTLIHPFATKVSEEEVVTNKAFPLVRELAHKYGLTVIAASRMIDSVTGFYMSREDGIPLCKVFFMNDIDSYAIRNCIKLKDRGRSQDAKLTYFAKKVSYVMKTVEKEILIPKDTAELFATTVHRPLVNMVEKLSSSYGEVRKNNILGGEIVHELIEIALGNRKLSDLSEESMDKVQSVLDKYRDADKTRIERQEELSAILDKPMWAVMYDATDTFCIGKMKLTPTWNHMDVTSPSNVDITIVEDFSRVADVTEITELIPVMAMLKTSIEQARPDFAYEFGGESKFFPKNWDGVSTSLGVMSISLDRWNSTMLLRPRLLMIPT